MRNIFKQFRFLPLVVMAIFIANGCSSDDNKNNDGDSTIIDGGTVYTSQVVTLARENLTQDTYEGSFNGNSIQIGNSGNNELVFIILPSIATIGNDNLLEIPALNLKVKYNVLQTTLTASPEETLQPFITALNNVDTSDSPQGDKAQNFINSFNQYYASLSETEREQMAEFYYANQELFDQTFSLAGRISENDEFIIRLTACESAKLSFVTLGGLAAATFSIAPPVSIIAATGAVVSFTTAIENCNNFMTAKIKQAFTKIESWFSERGIQSDEEFLQFENEVTKTLSVLNGKRAIQSSDSGDGNTYITNFFSTVTSINGFVTSSLNGLINDYNNYAPSYFQIEPFDNVTVPNNSPVNELALTQEEYNKYSFSVASSNVTIQTISYNNGSINVKLKIIDLTQVGEEGISTSLKYTYTDEFNNKQGSFPIKVVSEFSIIGNWTVSKVDDEPTNEWIIDGYDCPGAGEDVFRTGQANFTSTSFTISIQEQYNATWYDESCNITGTESSDDFLNYNGTYTYENDIISVLTAFGQHEEASWVPTASYIEIVDENTIICKFYEEDEFEDWITEIILVRQ